MAKKDSPRKKSDKQPKKASTQRNQRPQYKHPESYFLETTAPGELVDKLKLKNVEVPLYQSTLGEVGLATSVIGPEEFPLTILVQPYDPDALTGIDPTTVRVFRWEPRSKQLIPVWDSRINLQFRFIWSRIRHPGVYVPLGLPRDRALQSVLQVMAVQRKYLDGASQEEMEAITRSALELFLDTPDDQLEEFRRILAVAEIQTRDGGLADPQIRLGIGGHFAPYPLPGDMDLPTFRKRLVELETPVGGLPEEALFFSPEDFGQGWPPFPVPERPGGWPWEAEIDICPPLPLPWPPEFRPFPIPWPRLPYPPLRIFPLCWLFSRNWWMYHHDERHSGVASGCSNIRSTNVGTLSLRSPTTAVEGTVVTIPAVVAGKVYVGTVNIPGGSIGGKLYRIDLATGAIEQEFAVDKRYPAYYQGIGGSAAVVGGKIYFTAVPGRVYCIDANTFALQWVTDLRDPDPAHNQPVANNKGTSYKGDSWSSPLVVNGKVYVGSGEGEDFSTYGFVFCLDANTGNVIWLFCTNKFIDPANNAPPHNSPNVIPKEVAISDPLPTWATSYGFSLHPNPVPETGCSVWSSCAYDYTLNRIYVGTGNSEYLPGYSGGTDLPDDMYGSGMLALDASTGEFKGFHQPVSDDSYRPSDEDVDVPGSALIFSRGGQRVVAYGSKNGSFFLLDAATMQVLGGGAQRRQLLPRQGGTGLPGDRGTAIPGFAVGFENQWGMYATPTLHAGLGKLYVGLGGRGSVPDPSKTPFIRALDWNTLLDAWPHAVDPADNVIKYTTARPPLYTSGEVGLSSPAVVNDVVFMSTNKAALYGLDASTGFCLWSAPGLPTSAFALGPAIYGNYVVLGCGSNVYRYSL